jgi:hypothetical protein
MRTSQDVFPNQELLANPTRHVYQEKPQKHLASLMIASALAVPAKQLRKNWHVHPGYVIAKESLTAGGA